MSNRPPLPFYLALGLTDSALEARFWGTYPSRTNLPYPPHYSASLRSTIIWNVGNEVTGCPTP